MSLERLKKYSQKLALASKIAIIVILAVIVCETICFMWQALMPGKLTGFFDMFRIYAPFITNIDNNALCLFELAGNLFNNLFIFLMLIYTRQMLVILSKNVRLEDTVPQMKRLAQVLIADSVAVPVMKIACYTVFVKLPVPTGTIDLCPLFVGLFLYFIAIIIESRSVLKNETPPEE